MCILERTFSLSEKVFEFEKNTNRFHVCIFQLGQEMLSEDRQNSSNISRKMTQLSSRWRRLQDKMMDRGDKLRQAGQQEQLMELLQVLAQRLDK